MTHVVIILLVIGAILLLIEMLAPGFEIFGLSGIIALIAAAVLMIIFIDNGVYYALIMGVLVIGGIIIFLKSASKKGMFKKLVMDETLKEDNGITIDLSTFSGKVGVAVTPMRPIGTVDFGGISIEAYSTGAFISKGDSVIVTGSQDNKLFVKLLTDAEAVSRKN
jgi:membrane-bound serine protease (ClpP class)